MENEHIQELEEQFKALNGHLKDIVENMELLHDRLSEIRDKIYGGGVL
jgi:hypothetical protein